MTDVFYDRQLKWEVSTVLTQLIYSTEVSSVF